jgi:hypothetical protein
MSKVTDALKKAQSEADKLRLNWKATRINPPEPPAHPARPWIIGGIVVAFLAGACIGGWLLNRNQWQGRALYLTGTKLLHEGDAAEGREKLEELATEHPL